MTNIISYAQNFEDVMLWRALGHVENGFYIDIGAQDPVVDSVSLAFHEHGWQGIHVEPTPHYAELLRQQRPGDTVIQAAVGNGPAVLTFFEIPDTGISTADPVIAQQHRERGFDVHEITVPCITLAAIFASCTDPEIHWLKIDVEGFEQQVLFSWDKSELRPWVVVVESTLPLTQIETNENWEGILIGYGYSPVYFDGLNRYYVSSTHPELKDAFRSPPNVFDGFTLNGTASATFHHLIDARYQQKISETIAQNEQQKLAATQETERLTQSLTALEQNHAEREQTLTQELQAEQQALQHLTQDQVQQERKYAEQSSQIRQALENLLRTQTQREQEIAAQLLTIQQQADAAKAELSQQHQAYLQEIQRQQAEHEWLTTERIHTLNQELHRLLADNATREQAHATSVDSLQNELATLLRMQVQREQEIAAQLLAMQQHADQEKIEQAHNHSEQALALQREHAEREQALNQQLQAGQHQLHNLEQTRADMQHQLNAQLQAEREASQKMQQVLTALQAELATLRNSLSWRLTAPLRGIADWFKPTPTQAGNAISAAERAIVAPMPHPVPDTAIPGTQEFTSNGPLSETTSMTSNHSAPAPQPTSPNTTTNTNLKTLLQYQGHQFVEYAYLILLKRQPDADGLSYYLGRLRAGVPQIQILNQIINSREAQACGVELPGLRIAVKLHKLSRLPLLGRLFKLQNKYLSLMFSETALEHAKIQRQLDLIQIAITTVRSGSDQLPTTQNREMVIDQVTQGTIDVRVTDTAEMDGKVKLLADRSIDEPTWLRYLGQVINLRLIAPLRIAGTPPPATNLVVIIDCSEGVGTAEERTRTSDCLSALLAASEYPVKPFWYVQSDELFQTIKMGNPLASIFQVVNNGEIRQHICDEDLVLVLKPGDEVRPEIHMALKYFGSFDATLTLIDMYFRDNNRIYPVLLHAVDPIHASYCDYFFGRYAANGKSFKQHLDYASNATPSAIGVEICSQLKAEDRRSHRHIAIPLLCMQTNNAELAILRENIILERPSSTYEPTLISSPQGLEALEKSPPIVHQAQTVSAIICTKDCGLLLRQLLHRLEREALIYDIVIVSNNTTNVHAIKTLAAASTLEQVTVLDYNGSFNFSRQCNLGAKHAKGDVLLFLNDDMAPVSDDWLQHLLDWMDSPRIVGPLLIYPNESVQHAGMHLGFNGVAGHVMRHSRLPAGDYGFFLTSPRRVSCLTGAALMMPKTLFNSLNGFDPMLATYLQDVDLSLRALHSGCELVFDPRSILMHMESVSVTPTLNDTKIRRTRELEYAYFDNRWGNSLKSDKWMNPLFDPMDESLTVLRI